MPRNCAKDIKLWKDSNHSSSLGHLEQLEKCFSNNLVVNGEDVHLSVDIKYLGVYLDNHVNFKQHITHESKVAMLNICQIKNIKSTLATEATHTFLRLK